MACFYPISAFQTESGEVVFSERGKIRRSLTLPCGQCIGCRLEKSRQWAVRCMHEAQMHASNAFVTLTYDENHCPSDFSLRYKDFQLFMRKLRKRVPGVRFYMCGEYGDNNHRPHFHACLFGIGFADRYIWRKSASGFDLYRSAFLESLWTHGLSEIGDVSFDSAAYVARYIMKKVTGDNADEHYKVVDSETGEIYWRKPEFTQMSRRPGIGAPWFDKYKREVYPLDRVVVNGKEVKPPRYYDQLLKLDSSFLSDDLEYTRYVKRSKELAADNTPERLAVREIVAKARLKSKVRNL